MIIAGPCLLNNDIQEIENTIKTAKLLKSINPEIMFRCKLWGGGTTPEKYKPGIGDNGNEIMMKIQKEIGMKIGIEIRDTSIIDDECDINYLGNYDFLWVAARSCQNYDLLEALGNKDNYINGDIFIKRGPGVTIDETIGIHDICRDIYGYKPTMIERGINTFCRTDKRRWMPDFQGMLRILQERPDIELMFDPSHACGCKEDILPMVKAAKIIGVKHFMLEVYADPALTQTDKDQALSIEKFKKIYEVVNA